MIGDRYTLDREIGRGGMGAVWLGHDEVLGRPVALKTVGVVPGGSSPDVLRAEREARIAASLNHPNIVGVFDLIDDGAQQYLVMEYVEGRTLAALIRDQGPVQARDAARLLAQVADALASAHASGIVHRDVKPSNILVRDDGLVKLTDFGIARSEADASLTQTGMVTGSPAYLAPEVATGRPATPASDVWSLGATLFHTLAGRPPYEVGDNVLGALYQIVNEPPPRLPDAGEMASVLQATMTHDPRARWTMDDVARVLSLVAAAKHVVLPSPPAAPLPAHEPTRAVSRVQPDSPNPTAVLSFATDSASPPTPLPTPPPAPAAAQAPARVQEHPRRRAVLPVLVALLIVALVVAIVVLLLADDPQGEAPTGAGTSPSETTSQDPGEQSPDPSTPPARPTVAELEAFVADYLETADADPARGYELLTPSFQRASGGLAGYEGFWGRVSNVGLESVSADPENLTVSYTYRYDYEGAGVQIEDVTLQLRRSGGDYLIDGEA